MSTIEIKEKLIHGLKTRGKKNKFNSFIYLKTCSSFQWIRKPMLFNWNENQTTIKATSLEVNDNKTILPQQLLEEQNPRLNF